ncbi:MAG: hypothetical protein ABIG20_00210 [archaeon]
MDKITLISSVLAFSMVLLMLFTYTPSLSGMAIDSAAINLTVNTSTSISLEISTVDFGTLMTNSTDDTSDNSPQPFVVRNDGNVNVDVSIKANQSMFSGTGAGNDTDTFQFKTANCSLSVCGFIELNSFDWANSTISWTNFTDVEQGVIDSLEYANTSDEAEVDIRVFVPLDEPAGSKGATITFTATQES